MAIDLDAASPDERAPMMSLPASLGLALGQLTDRRILRVLVKSIAITLAIFVLFGMAGWYGISALLEGQGFTAGSEIGALLAVLLTAIGGWLLFRLVALAVLQFFADEIVLAVERRHYPESAATARKLSFREELANGARSTLRAFMFNLLALPFALALMVTGFGTALLFWAVNAWLLGRELQDMVWLRHRPSPEARAPLGQVKRFALGGTIAALLAIPFVNLLAPVLGAAAATHLVHRRKV